MNWLHSQHERVWRSRLSREQRHAPFTPNLPRLVQERPVVAGVSLALLGAFGNWAIAVRMSSWPSWMLFPSAFLAVLALVAMIVGLGILVVRALEPVVARMELDWDAEPLALLGIPLPLQRKCEQLGFWAADDLARAVERGKFPWAALEYDERVQVERAAHLWRSALERRKAGARQLSSD